MKLEWNLDFTGGGADVLLTHDGKQTVVGKLSLTGPEAVALRAQLRRPTELGKQARAAQEVAHLLGSAENWDGGADFLESIAETLNRVGGFRHPGDDRNSEWYQEQSARLAYCGQCGAEKHGFDWFGLCEPCTQLQAPRNETTDKKGKS